MQMVRFVVAAVVITALLPVAARGGPPGTWTRVTDGKGVNTDEAGVARTGDGVLHVVWPKETGTKGQIWHTPVSSKGVVGPPVTASGLWDSVGNPDLVVTSSGLRLFFGATGATFEQGGIQSATAPASGASWTAHPNRVSESVRAAGPVGATLLADGTPVFAWATGTNLFAHIGLSPATPDLDLSPSPSCCFYLPNVKRDLASGEVVVAFHSLVAGLPGIFVQTIRPAVGPRRLVPTSVTNGNFAAPDQRTPLVARSTGGLYVAFCRGYPTCGSVRVWRVGSSAARTVATGATIEDVNASPAPEGRIWVMWQSRARKRVYATRSNRAATRFGPISTVRPPSGTSSIWKVGGEGSAGPLDLLVSVSTPSSLATWHTQVRPRLSVGCKGGKIVSCTVSDAGDAVPGAKVKVAGKTLVTNANGKVSADLPRGLFKAVASKGGYIGASTRVRSK